MLTESKILALRDAQMWRFDHDEVGLAKMDNDAKNHVVALVEAVSDSVSFVSDVITLKTNQNIAEAVVLTRRAAHQLAQTIVKPSSSFDAVVVPIEA
jgi:hypothetical protein